MGFQYRLCISDRLLFYPCSGADWSNLVLLYVEKADIFVFSDLRYRFNASVIAEFSAGLGPDWIADDSSVSVLGAILSECQMRFDERGKPYRWIEPAWLSITYSNLNTNRTIKIVWRRGFGEYALQELPDNSIDIFCHRGDSDGEGGSATHFFENRKKRHPPLSKLFIALKAKLKEDAILISDGSNTTFRHLRKAARGDAALGWTVRRKGLEWELTSELPWHKSKAYGRCFEWHVKKAVPL